MAGAVLLLTVVLAQAVPHPFAGYLAAVLVGLAVTQWVRRQPHQRAARLFRVYLRAREGGADEATARERLVHRVAPRPDDRERIRRHLLAGWRGPAEKDRVVGGVTAVLAAAGVVPDPRRLEVTYDRVRDRFTIPGWDALPRPFVEALRARLEPSESETLDRLAERYRLFEQRFFRQPSGLGADPTGAVEDFARLLASLGHRLASGAPEDAERALRLSLRLRPSHNLAHGGLALLLARAGRWAEAVEEARLALAVLDALPARAATHGARPEDISPFRSPGELRRALEQVAGGALPCGPSTT